MRVKPIYATTFGEPLFRYEGVIHSVVEHKGAPAIIAQDGSNFYALVPDFAISGAWAVQVRKSEDNRQTAEQVIVGLPLHVIVNNNITPTEKPN